MKTTIGSFAELVSEDYGPGVAGAFLGQFSGPSQEVTFRQAMGVLRRVLDASAPIAFPKTGPTNTPPQERSLMYVD